ncbi:MAG: hypothetical protein EXS12_02535 [Phycisphaerales bacterium]|nr:hypothetical protein [Phycisphaerales bacterium]
MATSLSVLPTSTTSIAVTEIPGGVAQADRSQIADVSAGKTNRLAARRTNENLVSRRTHFDMVAMYRSGVKRVALVNDPLLIVLKIICFMVVISTSANAQESAPITIDTSPTATELLRRAQEASANNPNESARVLQEAVDRFPNKLVPWDNSSDRFQNTIDAANRFLLTNNTVRESWLRAESSTAQRRLDQGEVLQVAELRALTPAGLQAMFTLAQQSLDQGSTASALHWIDKALRHPALAPAQKKLLEDAKRDIALANISSRVIWEASTANEIGAQQPNEVTAWRPLWSVWLSETWLNRSIAELDPQAVLVAQKNAAINGSALVAKAQFTSDGVLIAEGATVRLLDRLSGAERWQHVVGLPQDRTILAPSDLSVAVPAGDLVITLPGQALADQRSGAQSRITALSIQTGALQWEVHLDRLGRSEFSELFPHGDPLILEEVVIVQARKSNSRLESAAWLIALDRTTGAFRWANSLGAAGGVRLAVSRPLSSPTQFNGDVIAATSLGVVARIDASNGHIVWLRKWSAPLREPRNANPAWQLPSPVVANDRVFWIEPDQHTLVCLSAQDGSTTWSAMLGVSEQLPAARALLADHERLYLLCEDVVAVDITDPRKTLWKLSEQLNERIAVRGECTLGTDAHGRPILAVPFENQALVLDCTNGHVLGNLPLKAGGNLALQDGQLVVVDAQYVLLAMPANEGERLLRARFSENPKNPRNGLALFEFGRAWLRGELMLEGAIAMTNAINPGDPQSNALLDEMLEKILAVLGMKEVDPNVRAQFLAIAKKYARSPSQQAAVALRVGDLAAAQGQLQEALEQWIALLESKEMRYEIVGNAPRRTSAKVAALERMLAYPQTSTMQLRKRAFENAVAQMRQCDSWSFINAVNMAALLACTPDAAHVMLQEAAARAQKMGWSEAEQMCMAMNSSDTAATSWPHMPNAINLPKLGVPLLPATTFTGRLLAMDPQAQLEQTRAAMLFAEPTSLFLRSSDNLSIVWRINIEERNPIVMAMAENIVLWCLQSLQDGALVALNPKDGASAWRIDSVAPLFQERRLADLKLVLDNQSAGALVCLRAGPVCALVRDDGEVIGVNNATGSTRWKFSSPIHAVDAVETSFDLVAIAGREIATNEDLTQNPALIQLISAHTGAVVCQRDVPEEWGRIRWVQIQPDCLLIATDEVIAALELAPNLPTRWSQTDRRYKDSPPAQVAGSWCLLRERSGNTVSLDMGTGQASMLPFAIAPSGGSSINMKSAVVSYRPFHGQWFVLRPQRLSLHSNDGSLQGADAVAIERRYESIILGQDTVYVVDSARSSIVDDQSSGFAYLLREFLPSEGLRSAGPPISLRGAFGRIARTDAIDGWIFIGGDDKTIAIPTPLSH